MSERRSGWTPRDPVLVLERIRSDARFVLATHENMDGDAIGSLVGDARAAHRARQGLADVHRAGEFPLPHRVPLLHARPT